MSLIENDMSLIENDMSLVEGKSGEDNEMSLIENEMSLIDAACRTDSPPPKGKAKAGSDHPPEAKAEAPT